MIAKEKKLQRPERRKEGDGESTTQQKKRKQERHRAIDTSGREDQNSQKNRYKFSQTHSLTSLNCLSGPELRLDSWLRGLRDSAQMLG